MLKYSLFLLGACIVSTIQAAPVSVDTSSTSDNAIRSPSLGATVSTTTRPYQGIGSQVALLPYFAFARGDFYVSGLNIGYRLNDSKKLRWDIIAIPRFLGYKESDSPVLNGLESTDYSLHGGLSVSAAAGSVNVNIRLLSDLLGESGGTEAIGTISRVFSFDKIDLTPALGIEWQNRDLVDHYYGVDVSQMIASRPAFSADATVNVSTL